MKSGNCYKFSLALSALCILGATTRPADADTPKYTILDLGTVSDFPDDGGNTYSHATGINNSGQVVGTGSKGGKSFGGFRTAPNSPINQATDDLGDLGTPGGDRPFGPHTFANGINESGQVVGSSLKTLEGSLLPEDAFRTAPNSPINPVTDDLGVLGGTLYKISFANGINNSGQVAGYSTIDSGQYHAFRTAPNSPINQATDDLGTLGGTSSYATAINQSGRVVGYSTTASGETHAFRTARNRAINQATDDLGTLGGTFSQALGINKLGQVVGDSTTASGETHAFLYDVRAHLIDLNSLISPNSPSNFSVLYSATAINDRGQIVGSGTLPKGCEVCLPQTHAFLATPVKTNEVTTQSAQSPDED